MLQPVLKLRNTENSVKIVRPFKDVQRFIRFNGNKEIVEVIINVNELKEEVLINPEKWFKDKEIIIVKENKSIEEKEIENEIKETSITEEKQTENIDIPKKRGRKPKID